MLEDRLTQKEPHGDERRHLAAHSKIAFHCALKFSSTVIIGFIFVIFCQRVPSSLVLTAKGTEISVTQTKKVHRQEEGVVMGDIPADNGRLTASQTYTIRNCFPCPANWHLAIKCAYPFQ